MIWPRQSMSWVENWPSPIISSSGLNDDLIHLNKFFRVTGTIMSVDVASFELVWQLNLSEWSHQSTESTFFPPEQRPLLETVVIGTIF
jgi:hypothetical protein